jgi:hypothetical protein
MSNAITKKVATKGMISVSQGQCAQIANAKAAAETKNNNQNSPFDLRFTSIEENFGKNRERDNSHLTLFEISRLGWLLYFRP